MLVGNRTRQLAFTLAVASLLMLTGCTRPAEGQTVDPPAPGGPTPPASVASPATTPQATATPSVPADVPVGFPVAPGLRPLRVVETPQGREVAPAPANSPTVVDIARSWQPRPENDDDANRFGWNCRLHDKYEGAPAVDWYLPAGTPVIATMRGQAELYVITTVNSFQYYGVSPRVTLGLPPPSMPLYPLPGPGGGMGVFVSILNGKLRAEYGHLDLATTLRHVPANAFVAPYSRAYPYDAQFDRPIAHDQITLVARWNVERGDTVGTVGNTGYSDVPHLHYQIVTADRTIKFCPTPEAYPSSGWLFGQPAVAP